VLLIGSGQLAGVDDPECGMVSGIWERTKGCGDRWHRPKAAEVCLHQWSPLLWRHFDNGDLLHPATPLQAAGASRPEIA
jgi:hypothetical protein